MYTSITIEIPLTHEGREIIPLETILKKLMPDLREAMLEGTEQGQVMIDLKKNSKLGVHWRQDRRIELSDVGMHT